MSNFKQGPMARRLTNAALTIFTGLAAFVPALHALDPQKSVFQYNCQTWTRQAGLTADRIRAIVQTKDGYIWLASQNGLIRFDGLDFKNVPIDLPSAEGQDIENLSLDRDGKLWFSISSGGYGSFDGRTFGTIGDARWTRSGINSHAILATRDGAIWTGSVNGWGRWVEGRPADTIFQEHDREKIHEPVEAGFVMCVDASDRVWMATGESVLYYWAEGGFKLFPDPELKRTAIYSIVQDRSGDLWIATGLGLIRYDSAFRRKEVFLPGTRVNALLIDAQGVLWAGTETAGLGRYQNGEFSMLRKTDGLASDNITSLLEDNEGSLWVGSTAGLSQLSELKFPLFSDKEGFVPGDIIAVAISRRGGLWATSLYGVTYFDGRKARNFQDPPLLPDRAVRRVLEARDGRVFFGDSQKNIGVLSGEPPVKVYPNELWPEAFAEDATSVLISIGPTLNRFQDGRFQPYHYEGTPPQLDWIISLSIARDNAIWLGTANGLFRVKDGRYRQWTKADGLPSNTVFFVRNDPDGSAWICTPLGIARVKDDHLTRFGVASGLPQSPIFALAADDLGYFWLDSGRGLLRVARRELIDFADGKSKRVHVEAFSGLESVRFVDRTVQAPSVAKTPDGRLWFPTPHGVLMVDPAGYFINRVPPRVSIQGIRVQGRDLAARQAATLQVGERNVEISFAALSYIAPRKIKVRYQLEGFDNGWIEGDARRTVTYNNLPAGRYVFRVQAANADGFWNLAGDSFSMELPPPFYQRPWFYALAGVAALLGLYGIYRLVVWRLHLRDRKLQAQNALLEAKVAERTDELARSFSLLQATLDSTADGILGIQLPSRLATYNRQLAEMWNIPPELVGRVVGQELRDIAAGQVRDPAGFLARIDEIFAHPSIEAFDFIELRDGRVFERYSKPQRLAGVDVGIVFNFRDITARRRAEGELLRKTLFLEAMANSTIDGILVVDMEGRKTMQNQRTADLFKIPPDIANGDDDQLQIQWVKDMVKDSEQFVQKVVHLYSHPDEISRDEIELKDGKILERYSAPVVGTGGAHFGRIWTFRDITGRKRLEAQLFQSQKLETIGKLAGGIAHEFNSILTAIIGQSELLLGDLPAGSALAPGVTEISKAAHRAAGLTRQLLAYGRKQVLQTEVLDLNVVLGGMESTLARLMGPATDVRLARAAALKPVKADAGQIEQVVLNLAMNAADAMPHGGKLTLETANVTLDQDSIGRYPELKPGDYVLLAVTDTGTGMSAEVKARVFEPFFSTKGVGEGTGLGLSTCYGIVRQSGGHIDVYSEPGRGTTFKLYLPQVDLPGKAAGPRREAAGLPRGTETILLVEDDPALREMAAALLARLGYTVLPAANGPDALSRAQQPGTGHIDLLFTDIVMPQITGPELAERVRVLFPLTRILFTSAYTENAIVHQGVLNQGVALLQKPFTPSALAHKLRDVLDGPER